MYNIISIIFQKRSLKRDKTSFVFRKLSWEPILDRIVQQRFAYYLLLTKSWASRLLSTEQYLKTLSKWPGILQSNLILGIFASCNKTVIFFWFKGSCLHHNWCSWLVWLDEEAFHWASFVWSSQWRGIGNDLIKCKPWY